MSVVMKILLPFSWLYGLGTVLRNRLFDCGWLRSRRFSLPVICVGNLSAGGTGKTPHTEYIARLLLAEGYRVAVLSRGYGRRTRGFAEVRADMDAGESGDEPLQMKRNIPQLAVTVCEDRCRGIELIRGLYPETDVIILDDAFQHRYVKAGLNILLTDFSRPYFSDSLLPAGRLREPASGARRADVIVVTKTPEEHPPFRQYRERIRPLEGQELFFSTFGYGRPVPLFEEAAGSCRTCGYKDAEVLVVTGIARPDPLWTHVEKQGGNVHRLAFGDHHKFTAADVERINRAFAALPPSRPRMAVTTEKDAARLRTQEGLRPELRASFFVQPVGIRFLPSAEEQEKFNQIIRDYVGKNSRNRTVD